jgi:hypothetical protein
MQHRDPRKGEAAVPAAENSILVVPTTLKRLVEPVRALIEKLEGQVTRYGRDGSAVDYAGWERTVGEQVAAIERAAHQCTVEALSIGGGRIVVGGEPHVRVCESLGTYYTMAGPIQAHRALYRKVGERNGKTVDVIGLRTGAVGDGWLPGAATAMAHYLQLGTAREAAAAAA